MLVVVTRCFAAVARDGSALALEWAECQSSHMSPSPILFRAVADHMYVASIPFDGEDGPAEVSCGLVVGSDGALLVDCRLDARAGT